MVSKTLVNLASRSRIRKRNEPIRSPMLMSTFRGADLHLPARRIRRTVASLIWWPSRHSSPCTLRYPQAGFSWASRSTRPRMSCLACGRPGRFGQVHRRVISRRRQLSSVPGLTSRWARSTPGSSRASAASIPRPGPVRPGSADLTAQHRDIMTEHHDLRVLGCLAAAEQHQPAEDPDHDQIDQAKGHESRSCRNQSIRPNRRSQYPLQVLKRYRLYPITGKAKEQQAAVAEPPPASGCHWCQGLDRLTGRRPQRSARRDISAAVAGRSVLMLMCASCGGWLYPNGRWSGWHVVPGGGSAPATR